MAAVKRLGLLYLVALSLLIAVGAATAQPPSPALDFALEIARDQADFQFGGADGVETRHTRVGIELYQTLRPWFQPGLTAGVDWLTQDGEPATEGRQFTGESVGVLLRAQVALSQRLALRAHARWVYHGLADEEGGDDLDMDWFDTRVRLGLRARFAPIVVEGGGLSRHIDGELRREGSETRAFEAASSSGVYLLAEVWVDPGGYVALQAQTGARDSIGISFGRHF